MHSTKNEKRDQLYVKDASSLGKGISELCKDCTEPLWESEVHNCGGDFCLYCKETHRTGNKKVCVEYIKESTIQNKII